MNASDLKKIAAKLSIGKTVMALNSGTAAPQPEARQPERDAHSSMEPLRGALEPLRGARIRHKKPLNKTEQEFYAKLLMRYSHVIAQGVTVELADMCRYTPDFAVQQLDGILVFFEVKGPFMREDSWIKLKVAARTYPWWRFVLAQKHKDGHWTETTIQP